MEYCLLVSLCEILGNCVDQVLTGDERVFGVTVREIIINCHIIITVVFRFFVLSSFQYLYNLEFALIYFVNCCMCYAEIHFLRYFLIDILAPPFKPRTSPEDIFDYYGLLSLTEACSYLLGMLSTVPFVYNLSYYCCLFMIFYILHQLYQDEVFI